MTRIPYRRFQWWVILVFVAIGVTQIGWAAQPGSLLSVEDPNLGQGILGFCLLGAAYIIRYGLGMPSKKNDTAYNAKACEILHKNIDEQLHAIWEIINKLQSKGR